MGAEGEGGGDDHQHRGAGQEEVLPVLAGEWLGGVRPGLCHAGGGECPGKHLHPPALSHHQSPN